MLTREADQRTIGIDVRLAALFAAVAGAVNAAGFHATGFFSANMTGNVSVLSDHLAIGGRGPTEILCALVVSFVFGAFCSALLIEAGRKRGIRGIYALGIVLEGVVLFVLGSIDVASGVPATGPFLAVGLSFAMGVQNAATTRISNARVRTTHVSGMATDIGLGLAALVTGGADRQALGRLRIYGSTIVAFLAGGVAGVILYGRIGGLLFLLLALLLVGVASPTAIKWR